MLCVIPHQILRRKNCAGHSAGLDPTPFSLLQRIISIWRTTQRHHKHRPEHQHERRNSSKDHIGGDVSVEGDSADDNSVGRPNPSKSDSRRRITTKREPREVREKQKKSAEQHVPRRILGKTTRPRTRSSCHHTTGTGWVLRENNEDRERRGQHIE